MDEEFNQEEIELKESIDYQIRELVKLIGKKLTKEWLDTRPLPF